MGKLAVKIECHAVIIGEAALGPKHASAFSAECVARTRRAAPFEAFQLEPMLHPIHSLKVLPPTLIEASEALHTRFRTAATDAGVTVAVPDAVLQTIFRSESTRLNSSHPRLSRMPSSA